MKNLFNILVSLLITQTLSSQTAPEIEWQNTIGGFGTDQLFTSSVTSDGNFIIGGASDSGLSGDKTEECISSNDFWVLKLNSAGNIAWQNTIGGTESDQLWAIDMTEDGGYILGGISASDSSADKSENSIGPGVVADYWVVKINSVGNIEWENTIGGKYDDELKSIQQVSDGGYILGGFSSSNKTGDKAENTKGNYDYWVLKLDAFGNIQWQNTIGGSGYDYLRSVQETTDGEFILGGTSNSGVSGDKTESSGDFDYWIIKINSIGNIIWQKTIGGSNIEELNKIQQSHDGGFIAIGTSNSDSTDNKNENSQGGYDFWIVKLDWLGNIEWQNTIGGSSYDFAKSGLQTPDFGYLIGGYSMSGISGDKTEESFGIEDYWVVKLNESGIIEWQKTIGGIGLDILYSVIQAEDGSYLLSGYSTSEVSGNKTEGSMGGQDYWIVKLYPENPPCSTAPTGLYTDFLTSSTAKLHWSEDVDAIKYKVQYRKSMVASWTNTSATSNVKNLFSLAPSTTYKFRVKTNCGAGVLSDWSNVATFTTLPLRKGEFISNEQINIYPNPNSGTFSFDLSEINTTDKISLSIKNLLGEEVYAAQFNPSSTEHQIQLDKNIYNGMYIIEISAGDEIFSKQIVVLK